MGWLSKEIMGGSGWPAQGVTSVDLFSVLRCAHEPLFEIEQW